MRPILICVLVGATSLGVGLFTGFVSGRFVQHGATGLHYEVHEQKEYDSPFGAITWSYVTETIGIPLLDPGTTVIKLGNRTIYKAERGFQESVPYADNIETSENSIRWDDGIFRYHLMIEEMKKGGLNGSADVSQPSQGNKTGSSEAGPGG